MNRIKRWMNKSFSRRIAAFFVPAILCLILIIGGISYYIYYTSISKEMQKNIIGTVEQGNYTVDLYFQDVKTTIVQLIDNDNLIYMLANYQDISICICA